MTSRTVIAHVMRRGFSRLSPGMPIREAVALLAREKVPAAPVIDERLGLVGILTEKDCFRPMLNASYYQQWSGSVVDYMSRDVRTLPADLDVVSAAEEFLARSHRVYPVVRETEVVGILYRSDLLAAILIMSEPSKLPGREP